MAAAAGYLLALLETDSADLAEANAAAHQAQVRLASLRAALDDACRASSLEVQTALKLAGATEHTSSVSPDAEQQAQIAEELYACLPDRPNGGS